MFLSYIFLTLILVIRNKIFTELFIDKTKYLLNFSSISILQINLSQEFFQFFNDLVIFQRQKTDFWNRNV